MANPQGVNGGSVQINYGLASQGANSSVINWNLQLVNTGGGGSSSYFNWSFNPGGLSGSGGWIYAVNNTVFASGQFTVNHDVNGNGYVGMAGGFSWYNGSGTATQGYTPPRIALAPTISSNASSAITTNSATLAGAVSSHGHGTSTTIRYYTRVSGVGSYVDRGTGATKALTGLSVNTTYQWYITATNNNGDVATGSVQTFKTKSGVKLIPPTGPVEDRVVKRILPTGVVSERVVTKIV